jgi:hypothetical protein
MRSTLALGRLPDRLVKERRVRVDDGRVPYRLVKERRVRVDGRVAYRLVKERRVRVDDGRVPYRYGVASGMESNVEAARSARLVSRLTILITAERTVGRATS